MARSDSDSSLEDDQFRGFSSAISRRFEREHSRTFERQQQELARRERERPRELLGPLGLRRARLGGRPPVVACARLSPLVRRGRRRLLSSWWLHDRRWAAHARWADRRPAPDRSGAGHATGAQLEPQCRPAAAAAAALCARGWSAPTQTTPTQTRHCKLVAKKASKRPPLKRQDQRGVSKRTSCKRARRKRQFLSSLALEEFTDCCSPLSWVLGCQRKRGALRRRPRRLGLGCALWLSLAAC